VRPHHHRSSAASGERTTAAPVCFDRLSNTRAAQRLDEVARIAARHIDKRDVFYLRRKLRVVGVFVRTLSASPA
jgi:hypothetical protein